MELKLLHLSDIHFQHYGANDHLDYDSDLRQELENDLELLVSKVDNIDAILISGDIAYSSKEEEYNKAAIWLDKLCALSHCKVENVLTVPGNHDINRKIGALLLSAHDKFKRLTNRVDIDNELIKYLMSDEDYSSILNPLRNYTAFAQKYSSLANKNTLYWDKDLFLEGVKLRIRGLNSTIISNEFDDETSSKLILGSHQTKLKREKGVVYLTMCHHPPQWLYDSEDVENDLHARARIQLYGHKHVFEINKDDKTIKLTAGAVHPSRKEKNWEPRYNLLGLSIIDDNGVQFLNIRVWERIWDNRELKFKPKLNDNSNEYSEYKLLLEEFECQTLNKEGSCMSSCSQNTINDEIEQIDLSSSNLKRKLTYKFFNLPIHLRVNIAIEMKLLDDYDEFLNSVQISNIIIEKAIENNLLNELFSKISTITSDK